MDWCFEYAWIAFVAMIVSFAWTGSVLDIANMQVYPFDLWTKNANFWSLHKWTWVEENSFATKWRSWCSNLTLFLSISLSSSFSLHAKTLQACHNHTYFDPIYNTSSMNCHDSVVFLLLLLFVVCDWHIGELIRKSKVQIYLKIDTKRHIHWEWDWFFLKKPLFKVKHNITATKQCLWSIIRILHLNCKRFFIFGNALKL